VEGLGEEREREILALASTETPGFIVGTHHAFFPFLLGY
jgi:hypothetical protein